MLDRVRPVPVHGLLQTDDVLPWLLEWRRGGHRAALVTVVNVEGGSPRSVGAQLAVSERGSYVGYLSGGCLEQAVASEALTAIREGHNRFVRYGKDSKYLDIRLPCGAGLDVYIDQSFDADLVAELAAAHARRSIVALRTDLGTGQSCIVQLPAQADGAPSSQREGDVFTRVYVPSLKLLVIGIGPAVAAIARLASSIGLDIEASSPNEATQAELIAADIAPRAMSAAAFPFSFRPDHWTAAVLAFHEHHWEPPIIAHLLDMPCFYIGALGSRATQASRLQALREHGVSEDRLARVRGPIGLIAGAKSRASLAIGVLAEIMAEAKERHFVA